MDVNKPAHEILVLDALASSRGSETFAHPGSLVRSFDIDVAPITQYTHVRNKNSNTQGSSPYVVKVTFHAREVPILKRDVIVENHCLIQ